MKKIACIALGLALLVGCGKKEKIKEKEKKPVKLVMVKKENVSDIYTTDGNLVPEEKVNHTLNSRGTVVEIYKNNGDFVKKGEIVVKFKDAAAEAAYNTANANYQAAKFNLESSKSNFSKIERLYNKQMVSQLEFLNYRNTYTNALGDFNAKKASFEDAKSNYNKLSRKADLTGHVGNLYLKTGNVVDANTTVFTIINDENMEVTVDFPGYWLNIIKVGSPATVKVGDLNNKEFSATIKEINPIADPETKKFPIKVLIKNNNKEIKDGMYATVVIPTEKRDSLVVPENSVFVRGLSSYVYKFENGKVEQVEVVTGAIASPNIEILKGNLKEKDQIVSEGIFGLSDGEEVRIEK